MKAKNLFRALRRLIGATRLYALPSAAFNCAISPPPFTNPVSAPGIKEDKLHITTSAEFHISRFKAVLNGV